MKHLANDEFSSCSVVGLDDEYLAGFVDTFHSHSRAQLLYASRGVMSVKTEVASFVIPSQRAIWIPGGVGHEVTCKSNVSLRTLYFDEYVSGLENLECHVVEISDLLRSLIIEAALLGAHYGQTDRNLMVVSLLIKEFSIMPRAPFQVKMPIDSRLLRICSAILNDPADHRDLDEFAKLANMSRRALTRAFLAETDMTFAIWRQQVRLMTALSLLGQGQPVTTVAFDVGYESASAFSAMFNRVLGAPPSAYKGI